MSTPTPIGIDVSARQLDVAYWDRSGRLSAKSFLNNPSGHKALLAWSARRPQPVRVCLEATGIYHLDLALALHRAPDVEVMVVNPRALANFAKALMARGKIDPLDAVALLEFAHRMPFAPWQPPSRAVLELRTITRRLANLTRTLTAEKNRLHAAINSQEISSIVQEDLELNIAHLESRIAWLSDQARDLIGSDPPLRASYDLLLSVKGIAATSAIRILAELAALPGDMTARQWVAHAGLDPRPVQSGSSIDKPRRISKASNRYLRSALFMPVLVAAQYDPAFKARYELLLSRGKKPVQANVALMRKLLHAIWGMFRSTQPFDPARFYPRAARKPA